MMCNKIWSNMWHGKLFIYTEYKNINWPNINSNLLQWHPHLLSSFRPSHIDKTNKNGIFRTGIYWLSISYPLHKYKPSCFRLSAERSSTHITHTNWSLQWLINISKHGYGGCNVLIVACLYGFFTAHQRNMTISAYYSM